MNECCCTGLLYCSVSSECGLVAWRQYIYDNEHHSSFLPRSRLSTGIPMAYFLCSNQYMSIHI